MINRFKADLYRIVRTKNFMLPILLVVVASVAFSYFSRDSIGHEGSIETLSSLSTFLPLFFLSACGVFFGEDFTNRTINTVIIKDKSRIKIFFYKTLLTIVSSLILVGISYLTTVIYRLSSVENAGLDIVDNVLYYQLPYYVCIVMLAIFIFNYFDRTYQSYLVYIVIVMMFDNLLGYILNSSDNYETFKDLFVFNNLKVVTGQGEYFTTSVIVALVFAVIYFIAGYYIFKTREFK